MSAIAAVDTALWDIKAKSLNTPLYQLLASRDAVLVYGHASGADIATDRRGGGALSEARLQGHPRTIRDSGLKSTYGVDRDAMHYEPAEKDAPPENLWSTEQYMSFVPSLFEQLRKRFGPEVHLLHDVHHRLTPMEAARLGKSLEPYHLFWLEDPTPAELQESFRLILRHTTVPLAVGEVFNTVFDCQQLVRWTNESFVASSR